MNQSIYDITIIGGGPAGMFAGFYAALHDAKVQIIESLSELGGQVTALYPKKNILDVAGFTGVSGAKLVQKLNQQLDSMNVDVHLNTPVSNIRPLDDGYQVIAKNYQTKTKSIIIATGNGAFKPRQLMADGVDKVNHQQLFYGVKAPNQFKNQTVLVAGGGDSAIDHALMLEKTAKQVYLLHRRDTFRGLEHMVDLVKKSSIKLETPYLIKKLTNDNDGKINISAKKMHSNNEMKSFLVDKVVIDYGFVSNNRMIRKWQIDLKQQHRMIPVNVALQTNLPHVSAIGDIATYQGKQDIIATAFGEVPIAVNSIIKQLYPDKNMAVHSTSLNPNRN
ncbi:ferredoxin--NADP reductase [Philodulcilactobacillus myokoensis]|uniref:Ferredoxin--NADP reductase n=1 Tax=Philodulcilactobacillus myokoensis TaxID=2929573 RepID=A0A9W6B401_9LACO|nr:NAD(P)/FAD-dependent oxidoreductase [Philodulcilactobacillus myokoensis]GLB47324.1 ferredoxin--NADP reductase [Philodulcilactobacillus myokoensis]